MPEMRFRIRWPSGREETCYSPSLVVADFLAPGRSYPLTDFLDRARQALTIASARVEAKYGRPCGLALGQLERLEAAAQGFAAQPGAEVAVLAFHA